MRPRLRALTARNNLAAVCANAGNLSRAIAPCEQTLDARERMLGADYPYQALIDAELISVIGTGPYDLLRLELEKRWDRLWEERTKVYLEVRLWEERTKVYLEVLGWSRQVH